MATITPRRARTLLQPYGFTLRPDPGFITGHRPNPHNSDLPDQAIRFFTWSNPKVADRDGIPRAYIIIAPILNGRAEHGRYRIPTVHWPTPDQTPRPWDDIAHEIETNFITPFNLPPAQARQHLANLDTSRYNLT